ncbi:MAG: glycosyltransferase family 2 protein [Lachnospiraceae bacterium]|nr:glycosyltransferase family 2 protein [Lachnospiraceae bacterium]
MMKQTAVIIPNYNGIRYIGNCLASLRNQSVSDFEVFVIDNGSTDGSAELAAEEYPEVHLINLGENTGFTGAVNAGLKAAESFRYALLLNNDTIAGKHFVEALEKAIGEDQKFFSCQASLRQMDHPECLDDGGDFYSVLGWAWARGKGKSAYRYAKNTPVFFSCAGAAIYRMDVIREIGALDPQMFAYLEDCDLGWRARLAGYENLYVPSAYVLHAGSGSSGSRYNEFKVKYTSRNSVYIIRKNMPLWQRILNFPFLAAGFGIKTVFFMKKGFGKTYLTGLRNGMKMDVKPSKTGFRAYAAAELWMLKGTVLRIREFFD